MNLLDLIQSITTKPMGDLFLSGSGILIIALTLVQVTPIKINPWSKIAAALGKAINREIIKQINTLAADVENLHKDIKELQEDTESIKSAQVKEREERLEKEAINTRNRILRFGDECRRGEKHSEEYFDEIMEDITEYIHYCDDHPKFKNAKATDTIEIIRGIRKTCYEQNLFI